MGVFMGMMDYFMVGLVFRMGTLFSVFGLLFSVGVTGIVVYGIYQGAGLASSQRQRPLPPCVASATHFLIGRLCLPQPLLYTTSESNKKINNSQKTLKYSFGKNVFLLTNLRE